MVNPDSAPHQNRLDRATRVSRLAGVNRRELATQAFLFLAGASLFLEVNIVGRLLLVEALFAALFPFVVLLHSRKLLQRGPATVIALALLWLLSQILTDLVRDTPFVDYSRGWSKIVFTIIDFCVLYVLIDNRPKRLVAFALGLAASFFIRYEVNPSEYMIDDPWKFGLGFAAAIVILVLFRNSYGRGVHYPLILAMMVLAAFVLSQGARSAGGICLATVAYMLVQLFLARRQTRRVKFSPLRAFLIFVGGTVVAMGVMELYSYAALQGYMGSEARDKYLVQSRGQYGLLLGGRNEIYASSQAIIDSPVLGHGSWAKDRKYVLILLELRRAGYQVEDNIFKSDLIPTHSHFFGAWVEAGILGALFWAWVLLLVIRVVTSLYLVRDPLVPLIVFLAINMLWDVLFSPYGHDRRIISDFSIIVLLFARDVLLAGRPAGDEAPRHESVHRHDLVQPGSVS